MKIFGIGANKTATTSLKSALIKFGFNPHSDWGTGSHLIKFLMNENYEPIISHSKKFSSFQDAPYSYMMDKDINVLRSEFPNAKFILTNRDPEQWYQSILSWNTEVVPLSNQVYKPYVRAFKMDPNRNMDKQSFLDQKEIMIDAFIERNENIKTLFSNDKNFLEINIPELNNPWEPLCEFLNIEIPSEKFPAKNVRR